MDFLNTLGIPGLTSHFTYVLARLTSTVTGMTAYFVRSAHAAMSQHADKVTGSSRCWPAESR
jgi:hypothetical protein